jgi:hypothetical protein
MSKYQDVINYFLYKADKIFKENSQSSKFRAINYKRVANIIEQKCQIEQPVDPIFVNNLPITNYMKQQILNFDKNDMMDANTKFNTKSKSNIKSNTNTKSNTKYNNKSNTKYNNKSNTNTKNQLLIELKNVLGIGDEKAKKLIKDGIKDIKELKLKKWKEKLSNETKLFLSKTPEKPIPNNEIKIIELLIKKLKFKTEFVGSYRRKKTRSNDIDIMIISDDKLILDKFLLSLIKLTNNKVYPYSKGNDKMSIIIDTEKITEIPHIYKLDIFRCPIELYIPMLLYSTGSKEFNIYMRSVAKRKGFLLNQTGLYNKNSGEKISGLNTEKSYFDFLNIPYKEPEERL